MIIDLSEKLDDIRRRHSPRPWQSREALEELRTLWGGVTCNECGVMETTETIRIEDEGQRSWFGEIRLATAPNGWFAIEINYSYSLGGGGAAPSVWNKTAFTTREEAVEAGIKRLVVKFSAVRDQINAPSTQAPIAIRMIAALEGYAASARQLSLF